MSDDINVFVAPTGRQLDDERRPDGFIGEVGILRPATKENLRLLRKSFLQEIKEKDLAYGDGVWTDKKSGSQFTLEKHFIDLIDLEASGVRAFAVAGDRLLFLRPRDAAREEAERVELGTMAGWEAGWDDRR